MDTKLKSDSAESAVTTRLLQLGYRVLKPIGDRLPYDLCVDANGKLLKIQVKSAWKQNGGYCVDTRRCKTNRRRMIRALYETNDFDYAVLYVEELNMFYIMPFQIFASYKSGISLIESDKRQRKPKSWAYRDAWHLLR